MMKWFVNFLLFASLTSSCTLFKPNSFYDETADDATKPNIAGFEALSIYSDQLSSENWFTKEPAALNIKAESQYVFKGSQAISIEWNKQAADIKWMGMGFGWLNWSGKNFESIVDKAALSFRVKSKKGTITGLPWAVGFEDFSGTQAWSGVTGSAIIGSVIRDDAWAEVHIPLQNFQFEAKGVEVSSIKQLIFQFESSGKVWIDEIQLVPHTPKGRAVCEFFPASVLNIDGIIAPNEWSASAINLPNGRIYVSWDNQNLYAALIAEDETPGVNNQSGKDIWNGDALELAFSSLSGLNPKRSFLYPEDCHIGISMGPKPEVFNWATGKTIDNALVKKGTSPGGYSCEIAIPWTTLSIKPLAKDLPYDFEAALDMSNASGVRGVQQRWNSSDQEGFHQNPSLWGTIIQRSIPHE